MAHIDPFVIAALEGPVAIAVAIAVSAIAASLLSRL